MSWTVHRTCQTCGRRYSRLNTEPDVCPLEGEEGIHVCIFDCAVGQSHGEACWCGVNR